MRHDATYPERFRDARRQAAQALEDEAVRRARYGVSRPVLYQGKPVYFQGMPLYETDFSDRLLERLLEANDPDRFKRRAEQTNLLEIDPEKLTPAQLDVLVDHLLRQTLGDKA